MADDASLIPPPPEGFVRSTQRGPFTSHNGPLYHRAHDDMVQQAFYALDRHANGMGLVHGGMLSAFIDGILAGAVVKVGGHSVVTMNLSINFLHMARVGEWLIGEAKATRVTRDVGFSEGRVFVGDRDVIRASGVFKLLNREAPRA